MSQQRLIRHPDLIPLVIMIHHYNHNQHCSHLHHFGIYNIFSVIIITIILIIPKMMIIIIITILSVVLQAFCQMFQFWAYFLIPHICSQHPEGLPYHLMTQHASIPKFHQLLIYCIAELTPILPNVPSTLTYHPLFVPQQTSTM